MAIPASASGLSKRELAHFHERLLEERKDVEYKEHLERAQAQHCRF